MEILLENGKTYLKGFLTEADVRNRNGRLYPKAVAKAAVLELQERVKNGGVLSYLNHPPHADLVEADSCGKIVEVEWLDESGRATSKVEIFNFTKDGKSVLERINNGETFGISTRGTGALDENKVVQPGLKFVTGDIIPGNGYGQSCQVCTMSLTEAIDERTNTMEDYLLEVDEKPCGCVYAKLNGDDKVIAENYFLNTIEKMLDKHIDEARKPKGFIKDSLAHEKVLKIINGGWKKSDGVTFELKSDGTAVMNIKGNVKSLVDILSGYSDEHNHTLDKLDGAVVPASGVSFYIEKISDLEYEALIK